MWTSSFFSVTSCMAFPRFNCSITPVSAVSEVAERGALETERLTVGSQKPRALTRLDLPDFRYCHIRRLCRSAEVLGLGRRHGANDFIVVATSQHRLDRARLILQHGLGGIR